MGGFTGHFRRAATSVVLVAVYLCLPAAWHLHAVLDHAHHDDAAAVEQLAGPSLKADAGDHAHGHAEADCAICHAFQAWRSHSFTSVATFDASPADRGGSAVPASDASFDPAFAPGARITRGPPVSA